jgi:hypothetical protein
MKNGMPTDGKPVTKDFEGRQYHINYKYHPKQWVCHSESSCSKNPSNLGLPPPINKNGRKLPAAQINSAMTDPSEDLAEESQEEDYRKICRKAFFFAFCRPLPPDLALALNELLGLIWLECWVFWAGVQVFQWLIVAPAEGPTNDLYIPCAKCIPLCVPYLAQCSN